MSILQEDQFVALCETRKLEHPRKRHAWLAAAVAVINAACDEAGKESPEAANQQADVQEALLLASAAEEAIAERSTEVEAAEVLDPDDPANSEAERNLKAILGARFALEEQNRKAATDRAALIWRRHAENLAGHHHANRIALLDEGRRSEIARAHEEALSGAWTPETKPFETAAHA